MANIAVVGTGLVGSKMLEILADKLPEHTLTLFGNTSVGQNVCKFGKSWCVQPLSELTAHPFDLAMFMATEQVSKAYVPKLTKMGTVCIDNSAAFRMHKNVPLVVPQINGEKVTGAPLIANPNCTTIQVVIALKALLKWQPHSVTVCTFQSVSGAGRDGLTDLSRRRTYGNLQAFRHPIFDNVIAEIGEILPTGDTSEERKMKEESKKILSLPDLSVNAFCVRVPVTVGHGAFVNVKLKRPFEISEIVAAIRSQPNVLVFEKGALPQPITLRNTHFVGVGRIHKFHDSVNMFVVADNLLRGAAYNAYEILQCVLKGAGNDDTRTGAPVSTKNSDAGSGNVAGEPPQ